MAYEFIHPTHTTFKHHLSLETLFRSLPPVSSRQVLCFISSTHPQQESKAFPGWPSCAWCFQWHQPLLAPKLPKLSLNISELKSTSIGCSSTSLHLRIHVVEALRARHLFRRRDETKASIFESPSTPCLP